MSILKKKDNKVFQLYDPPSQATFFLDDTVLTVELVAQGCSKVYSKTFTPSNFKDSLTSYFDSPSILFSFVSQVSDKFVSTDGQGTIKIAFLAEELQEKSIEISLDGHNQAQMMQRIRSLESSFSELAKHAYQSKKESNEELQAIRKDFMKMGEAYEKHINDLEKKVEEYSHYFGETFKGQIYGHKKHHKLAITQNMMVKNQRCEDNEVRWAVLGPQVSLERNTVILLKVNKLEWLAIGFCEQQAIQSRKYSRLNGCGPHGSYVMDNSGWVYAQGSQSNYNLLGFTFKEEDTISLIYNPKQQLITFVSHSTWQRYELHFNSPAALSPCIACNKETDISVLDYSM